MNNLSNISDFDADSYNEFIFGIINFSIYLVCSFLSIFLNCLLIISWLINCKKDNFADFILFSNAICNFINGFFVCQSFYLIELKKLKLIQSELINQLFENIVALVDDTTSASNSFSLLLISIHRLRQLIGPFKENPKITRLRIFYIISISFICLATSFLKYFLKFMN